jgi:hypothetical protein
VVQIGHSEKFLEMIFGRLSLALEVTFRSRYALLANVVGFLIIVVIAGYYGDMMGHRFCPFLLPLAPFRVPLAVALVGTARPPLAADRTQLPPHEKRVELRCRAALW